MNYQLVFDVAQQLPDLRPVPTGLLFIAVGLGLWRFRRSPLVRGGPAAAGLYLGFAVVATIGAAGFILRDYAAAQAALRDGAMRVVEGRVEGFQPYLLGGRKQESFAVGGVRFAYSPQTYPGYNRVSGNGGPIRESTPVRIRYLPKGDSNVILRLEVWEQPPQGRADG